MIRGRGRLRVGGGILPPLTNLVSWFRIGRSQTIVGGGVNALGVHQPATISAWNDQKGANNYAQATGAAQPTEPGASSGVGFFGDGTALFNGTSSILTVASPTLSQPYTRCFRLKQKVWTSGKYLCDGFGVNLGVLSQQGVSPGISMYAGTGFVANNTAASIDTWVSVVAVFNGASSILRINGVEQTGNPGASGIDGLSLGAAGGNSGQFSNIQVAEELVYSGAADAATRASIEQYLNTVNPGSYPVTTTYNAFGDSITAGFGVTTAWPILLAASPNVSLGTNYAVSGNQAIDTCEYVYANSVKPGLIMIGTNDQRTGGYGTSAPKLAHWRQFMRGMFAWLSMPTKTTGQASTNTAGTWTNTTAFGGAVGVQSTVSGSQRTVTTTGDIAYIWTVIQDGEIGTWKVTEGGVTKATGTTAPNATIGSANARNYGVIATRISGLGAGSHTLVFETTNAGLSYFIGAAGIGNQTSFNAVYSANVISPNATGLASYGVDETNVAAYDSAHAAEVAAAAADGMTVYQVDLHSLAMNYQADGLHPNQAGQQQISDKFKSTMGAV